jgi:hypothetical protein
MEVLDKALGLPEYPGRVRGAGYGVRKGHFLPKGKRVANVDLAEMEARIRGESKAEVDALRALVATCMEEMVELRGQQHGNAPSSSLNESRTQAPQNILPEVINLINMHVLINMPVNALDKLIYFFFYVN